MKYLGFFVAVIALTRVTGSDTEDEALARAFIACTKKALDGGLPSIPIPDHNPLVIRNLSISQSPIPLTQFNLEIFNNNLWSVLDFEFVKINATAFTNPDKVLYEYDLYWPILNITGEVELGLRAPFINNHYQGTYNIIMSEIHWTGIFNLTKPGQKDVKEHLDELTLNSATESVEVYIDSDIPGASAAASALEVSLLYAMNNFAPSTIDTFVKDTRFNGFWIGHPERIDAIIENC